MSNQFKIIPEWSKASGMIEYSVSHLEHTPHRCGKGNSIIYKHIGNYKSIHVAKWAAANYLKFKASLPEVVLIA
jgi:hypothetical protein